MEYPIIEECIRVKKLMPPAGKIRMVLDTDTYNEVDDQFALAYALKSSDNISLEAVYAAPFFNSRSKNPCDGMEKSYDEILKLYDLMKLDPGNRVKKGSTQYIQIDGKPQENDAVQDLIQRAMASPESDPLYVCAIGAITNVASAIMLEPRILEKIVVVWLGGHAFHWPHTMEFNLMQDGAAARVILDSGVPLILIPCNGVCSMLTTTIHELQACIGGKNSLCDYLIDIVRGYNDNHFGWSKVIWDISTIAWINNIEMSNVLKPTPILKGNVQWDPELMKNRHSEGSSGRSYDPLCWSFDSSRHLMQYVWYIDRDAVYKDLFNKIS